MFTIVFGKIARIPTDGVPPFLFYMAGTVLWSYFASIITGTATTFTGNAHIFSKVYVPRLAVPVSSLISRLIAFTIQFAFFLCFPAWFAWRGADVAPTGWIVLTPSAGGWACGARRTRCCPPAWWIRATVRTATSGRCVT